MEAPTKGDKFPASITWPRRVLFVCEKEGMPRNSKAQKATDFKKDIRDVILRIPIPNAQENLMFVNSPTLFDS
jgi:hypothetical protein